MSLRFRKSFKIAPGVRMNVGKRGISSLSLGKTNFGRRGIYQNFTVPGTGISYRATVAEYSRSSKKSSSKTPTSGSTSTKKSATFIEARLTLSNDGALVMQDKVGRPLPDDIAQLAKRQNKEAIVDWLQEQADIFNQEIDELVRIHLTTPNPNNEVVVNPKPLSPKLSDPGIASKFIGKLRDRAETNNKRLQLEYEQALMVWQQAEHALRTDPDVMSAVLANALSTLEWPRETTVSFEIRNQGTLALLDIDLPEIEDMPDQEASVNRTQLRLNIKPRSAKRVRLDYLAHIHAIGFKFLGEVFAHLPSIESVVLSGYSQRINKSTARLSDEYLYSVRVRRNIWERINFDLLEALDVVECFSQFDLRRKVNASGQLTAIDPFDS